MNVPDGLTVTVAFGALALRRALRSRRPPPGGTDRDAAAFPTTTPSIPPGAAATYYCRSVPTTATPSCIPSARSCAPSSMVRSPSAGRSMKFSDREPRTGPARSSTLNLFAFRDGTANPDVADSTLMHRLVWLGPGRRAQPPWTTNGTFQGRSHDPDARGVLGPRRPPRGAAEHDRPGPGPPARRSAERTSTRIPRYDLDPHGTRIPLDAHIRLADPRTTATSDQLILRRSYSYHRGVDLAGDARSGPALRRVQPGPSAPVRAASKSASAPEPMVDYITPVGGGYFFAPRGARGEADWVGSGLAV